MFFVVSGYIFKLHYGIISWFLCMNGSTASRNAEGTQAYDQPPSFIFWTSNGRVYIEQATCWCWRNMFWSLRLYNSRLGCESYTQFSTSRMPFCESDLFRSREWSSALKKGHTRMLKFLIFLFVSIGIDPRDWQRNNPTRNGNGRVHRKIQSYSI